MYYSKKTLKRFKSPEFAGEIKNPDVKTYGCIAAIASSDMMCELAKGKTIDEALKIKAEDIVNGLGKMPPIKFHCSILGTQALKKAIENYRRTKK